MSWLINKGSTAYWYPTLRESSIIPTPTYLWQLTNATNNPVYFIAQELSSQLNRYNKFLITETSNPNPLLGQVELQTGDYDYKVFEQTSTTNLDPTGLNEVEIGVITCIDDTANSNKIDNSSDVTNKIFNG